MVRLIIKLSFNVVLTLLITFCFSEKLHAINNSMKLPSSSPVITVNQDFNKSLIQVYKEGKETQKMGHGIKKVVLDAGHGGKDFGTRGKEIAEKNIALDITLKLGRMINENFPEVEVIYTREKDVFVPLHKRAEIANKSDADLFISIHCNYSPKRNEAVGTETFVMGLHRAQDNLEVAKRENASILMEDDYKDRYDGFDPNSNEGHIAMSMYQHAFLENSIAFANLVEKELSGHAKRESRGVKQAGFLVLRNTVMPSVLIETGFLSDQKEEAFLNSDRGKDQIAWSLFKAFTKFKIMADDLASRPHSEDKIVAIPASYTEQVSPDNEDVNPAKQKPAEKQKDPAQASTSQPVANPDKIEFVVQISASKNKLKSGGGKWDKVNNVMIRLEKDMYKYQVGECNSYKQAADLREDLKKIGFTDAFIVAYNDGKRINIQDALRLHQ